MKFVLLLVTVETAGIYNSKAALLHSMFHFRVKIFLWQTCHTQKGAHMPHLQGEFELILHPQ
jgi:hypothetical protein